MGREIDRQRQRQGDSLAGAERDYLSGEFNNARALAAASLQAQVDRERLAQQANSDYARLGFERESLLQSGRQSDLNREQQARQSELDRQFNRDQSSSTRDFNRYQLEQQAQQADLDRQSRADLQNSSNAWSGGGGGGGDSWRLSNETMRAPGYGSDSGRGYIDETPGAATRGGETGYRDERGAQDLASAFTLGGGATGETGGGGNRMWWDPSTGQFRRS